MSLLSIILTAVVLSGLVGFLLGFIACFFVFAILVARTTEYNSRKASFDAQQKRVEDELARNRS